jgi:hypothetical protein
LKKIFLILISLISYSIQAQTVSINKSDDVFVNDSLIGKFEVSGDEADPMYIFSNLDGEDLISVERDQDQPSKYIVTYMEVEDATKSISDAPNVRLDVIKTAIKNNLFKNNILDPEAVKKYCKVKSPKLAKDAEEVKPNKRKQLTEEEKEEIEAAKADKKSAAEQEKEERLADKEAGKQERRDNIKNKKEDNNQLEIESNNTPIKSSIPKLVKQEEDKNLDLPILLKDGFIYQANKQIGKFTCLTGMVNGKKGRTISLFTIEGKRAAKIKVIDGDNKAEMLTAKDAQAHLLGFNSTNAEQIVLELITEAVSLGYLN